MQKTQYITADFIRLTVRCKYSLIELLDGKKICILRCTGGELCSCKTYGVCILCWCIYFVFFFFVDIFSFFEFFMLLSLFPPGYFDFIYALLTGGVN